MLGELAAPPSLVERATKARERWVEAEGTRDAATRSHEAATAATEAERQRRRERRQQRRRDDAAAAVPAVGTPTAATTSTPPPPPQKPSQVRGRRSDSGVGVDDGSATAARSPNGAAAAIAPGDESERASPTCVAALRFDDAAPPSPPSPPLEHPFVRTGGLRDDAADAEQGGDRAVDAADNDDDDDSVSSDDEGLHIW